MDTIGNLIPTRMAVAAKALSHDVAPDPVRLEIMGRVVRMAIAEEMGGALQRSAASVNIRERLDFSCALFDAQGNLIANAPHMPVHLGSMGEMRVVLARRGNGADGRGSAPGDVYALNDPTRGHASARRDGDHAGVPERDDAAPYAFVAARGHQADIGGITPGSMPPFSQSIAEGGVLLDNVLVVRSRAACSRRSWWRGCRPGRGRRAILPRTSADLKAQIAACARGAEELQRLLAPSGPGWLRPIWATRRTMPRPRCPAVARLADGNSPYARSTTGPRCGGGAGRP